MEQFLKGRVTLYCGDSREEIKKIADASLDSVCCDPPYALVSIVKRFGKTSENDKTKTSQRVRDRADGYARLSGSGFMGKTWDTGETAFAVEFWAEVFRVLKPGGHVVAFSGSRTYHRMVVAIEDAGFEVRDQVLNLMATDRAVAKFMDSLNDEQRGAFLRCIEESQFGGQLAWLYGSGFPKSHDVSKGIDKAAGAVRIPRAVIEQAVAFDTEQQGGGGWSAGKIEISDPVTEAAKKWEGWGTALKPAQEPIVLARKPLIGTVVQNVMTHGTGALNIDGTRVGNDSVSTHSRGSNEAFPKRPGETTTAESGRKSDQRVGLAVGARVGRWPANVVHDGSEEVVEAFPGEAGAFAPVRGSEPSPASAGTITGERDRVAGVYHADAGSAARFFYTAKADAQDRLGTKHPTVKPVDLMRWLVRLVTPPGGTTLDPFAGTGSTGEAAFLENMNAILIEREPEYQEDIRRRMALVLADTQTRRRTHKTRKAEGKPKPPAAGFLSIIEDE